MQRTRYIWPFHKATDMWHVGIVAAPIDTFLEASDWNKLPTHWLPLPRPFSFIADPFARAEVDGGLTILAEALDYRVKRGEIHYYRLDANYQVHDSGVALRAPTHLSYPYLIQHAGDTYMLPESYRTGKLTLYRAVNFPSHWEPVADLLALPAIDASITQHEGRWWMFFSLPGEYGRALNELHIAYAYSLLGPWQLHAGNPVRAGRDASRMGGTPFFHHGKLHLPMQDCSATYGGALNILRVETLSPTEFSATTARALGSPKMHPDFTDGMHTLSACGGITLIDVKHTSYSPMRHAIDAKRRLSRLLGTSQRSS